MAYQLKTGESIIDDKALDTLCFNERSKSHFSENTEFDFAGCQLIDKVSNGNHYLKFGDMKKNGKEATISASMFLRCPFNKDNRKPLTDITTFQDELLKAVDAPNPGKALWDLVKGRRIKVVKVVNALDRPFNGDHDIEMPFSIFDLA